MVADRYTKEGQEKMVLRAIELKCTRLGDIIANVHIPERVVDRTLQRLRKRGVIAYTQRKGWHILKVTND
jgi:hypothetical protein